MATCGIGDVLTGLTAALIAQGMAVHDAAAMGSWLVGRSAEISLGLGLRSVESLAAGDIADLLGDAFDDIRDGVW